MIKKYNKWDLIDKALGSTLGADDKSLLIELIRRCDYENHKNWECWPSVQRLAQVRGIKYEKNFKGADVYLPGLVIKKKRGRNNYYVVDPAAIMELEQFESIIKHTPARADNTPAVADNTPAVADNTPAVAGANSTVNNTIDSTDDSTSDCALRASSHSSVVPPSSSTFSFLDDKDALGLDSLIGLNGPADSLMDCTHEDTPSRAGVSPLGELVW